MKKTIITTIILALVVAAFAKGQAPENPTAYNFNNPGEVAIELERGKTEITMHILLKDASQYDKVIIERSADVLNNYGQCKYMVIKNEEQDGNDYFKRTDRYPLPTHLDSYYRVVTVSKDGVKKTYPGVLLPGIKTTADN